MSKWNLDAFPNTLLSVSNPKTMKGEKDGYLTAIMHLAPHKLSGANLCAFASAGCAAACLNTAGQGGMALDEDGLNRVQVARIQRSRLFRRDRKVFFNMLITEIEKFIKKAETKGMTPAIRLNGTSDIPWEKIAADEKGRNIFQIFPNTQFYDYTKYPIDKRGTLPSNYHLTFSLSEDNDEIAFHALSNAINVAVVLNVKRSGDIPITWNFLGRDYPVVDGDKTDLRFLDPLYGGIVALRGKGTIKRREEGMKAGFIREAS